MQTFFMWTSKTDHTVSMANGVMWTTKTDHTVSLADGVVVELICQKVCCDSYTSISVKYLVYYAYYTYG